MKRFEIAGLPSDDVKNFVAGTHSDPFRVLGPHGVGDGLEIRVFRPDARAVEIMLDGHAEKPIAAERIHQDGFFCATRSGASRDLPYRLRDCPGWIAAAHTRSLSVRADHGRG